MKVQKFKKISWVLVLSLSWMTSPSSDSFFLDSAAASERRPYELKVGRELIIFGGTVGVGVPALALRNQVSPLTPQEIAQLNPNQVNGFDRSATSNYSPTASKVSDYLLAGIIVAPSALLFSADVQSQYLTVGTMYLETVLLAAGIPGLVKVTAQRIRPFVYNPNAPLDEKMTQDAKQSFFSGHASVSFSSAVFLSSLYSNYYPDSEWKWAVWSGSLAAASTISYLRYEAGKHFPTDLITGAAVGALVGYAIPALHRTNEEKKESSVTVLPQWDGQQVGVTLGARF